MQRRRTKSSTTKASTKAKTTRPAKASAARAAVKKFSSAFSKSSMKKVQGELKEQIKARDSTRWGATAVKIPDGSEFFRPKKGTMLIDIVPYVNDDGQVVVRVEYYVHRNIGLDDATLVCPKNTLGKGHRCPVCEEWSRLKSERGWDDDTVKALRASRRELYNIYDHSDDTVKVWDVSAYIFGDKLDEEWNENEDVLLGYAGEDGHSIRIRFKEKTAPFGTFLDVSKVDFVERPEALDEEVLEQAIDLEKCLIIHPYQKLSAIFYEEEDPADDEKEDGDGKDKGDEPEEPEEGDEPEEPEEEPEDEPEEPEEEPEGEGGECPAGGTFGADYGAFIECADSCELWEECEKASDEE